ncbi:MAG TPA: hypothetical protein PLY32_00540 [Salinivirgaceae bacterium]|nr:hypothetical protein [Salinivirgaceae bacterium]
MSLPKWNDICNSDHVSEKLGGEDIKIPKNINAPMIIKNIECHFLHLFEDFCNVVVTVSIN